MYVAVFCFKLSSCFFFSFLFSGMVSGMASSYILAMLLVGLFSNRYSTFSSLILREGRLVILVFLKFGMAFGYIVLSLLLEDDLDGDSLMRCCS